MEIVIIAAFLFSGMMFADEPQPVKVYCFSADLEAGFKDVDAKCYCVELAKAGKKKASLVLAEGRDDAQVFAEYLGAEQFEARGEATYLSYGIAWTPTETRTMEAVLIKVGDHAKAFTTEGINAQASGMLVRQTEAWIRENREVILQKTKKK